MDVQQQLMDWEKRMKKRPEPQRPEVKVFPFGDKLRNALAREVELNQRCPQCKHMNKPKDKHIIIPIPFQFMGEQVPLLVWCCHQCGLLFSPQWARKIIVGGMQAQDARDRRIEGNE